MKSKTKREIKFRIWSTMINAMSPAASFPEWLRQYQENPTFNPYKHLDPEHCIIMQYTGRKDKKGKEIFEGDLVKQQIENEFGSFSEAVSEVCWCEAHHGFETRTKDYSPQTGAHGIGSEAVVVGNIYETPDLFN